MKDFFVKMIASRATFLYYENLIDLSDGVVHFLKKNSYDRNSQRNQCTV